MGTSLTDDLNSNGATMSLATWNSTMAGNPAPSSSNNGNTPVLDVSSATSVIAETAPFQQGDRVTFETAADFRDYVNAKVALGIRSWASQRNINVDQGAGSDFSSMFGGMLQMSMQIQQEMMKFNMAMAQARMQQQMFQQMLGAFGGAAGMGGLPSIGSSSFME